uniref:Uncharacterized protein n=1 Tax=Oryza rufipogon TaxID=4529 RepID=A0A0E0QAB5_ORYRU
MFDTSPESSGPNRHPPPPLFAGRRPPPAGRIPVACSFGGSGAPSSLTEPPAEDFHQFFIHAVSGRRRAETKKQHVLRERTPARRHELSRGNNTLRSLRRVVYTNGSMQLC